MKIKKGNFILFFLLFLLSFFSIIPFLNKGYFLTDDGAILLIRLADGLRSFKDGQFPLVWAGYLNHGYGYPIFIFLYPLYLYIGIFFKIFGLGLVAAFKAVFITAMIVSAFAMYLFLRQLYSKTAAFFASLIYLYAPYHLAIVYQRASIGEALVLAFAPLVFWSFLKVIKTKGRAKLELAIGILAFTFLILSHNSLALIFTAVFLGFLLFYFLFYQGNISSKVKKLKKIFLIILFGLGLSCFFWLPALSERQFIRQPTLQVANFGEYFINLAHLKVNLFYGQNIFLGLGSLLVFLTALSVLFFFFFWLKRRQNKKGLTLVKFNYLFFLIMFIVSLFFSLPVSSWFWQNFNLGNLIQFPFRFLGPVTFSATVMAAFLLDKLKPKKIILAAVLFALFFNIFNYSSKMFTSLKHENLGDDFYLTNDSTTDVRKEYMPVWVKSDPGEYPDRFVYVKTQTAARQDEKKTNITNLVKESDSIGFNIVLEQKSRVVFNQVYFPGWQLKVDYSLQKIIYENRGLIEFDLDRGEHYVEIRFRDTPARRMAKIISFAFLALLVFYFTRIYLRKALLKLSSKKYQNLVFLILFSMVITNLGFYFYRHRDYFLKKYDHVDYSLKYANSQYIDRKNPDLVIIADDQLYAYAGLEYVKGVDPTKISFEHPPLGKYLIGLSILIFNNQNIIMAVMGAVVLGLFYLIALSLFNNKIIAGFLTLLLSLEPLFKTQLITSLLDLPQLLGIMSAYYFYLKAQTKRGFYPLLGVAVGFAVSVKYGLPVLIFIACLFGDQFLRKKSNLKYLLFGLLFSLLPFLISYFQFFKSGAGLRDFFEFQKWLFSWFTSKTAFVPKFLIFKTIFLGLYLFWDQQIGYIYNSSWTYFWPLIYLVFFAMFIAFLLKKLEPKKYFLLFFWPFLYLLFLIPGAAAERYLIIIMPFVYLGLGVLFKRYLVKFNSRSIKTKENTK